MSNYSVSLLEFDKIQEIISNYASSALGREAAKELYPSADILQTEIWLQETSELLQIVQEKGSLPLTGLHQINEILEHCRIEGIILEPEDLLKVLSTLQVASKLKDYFFKEADRLHRTNIKSTYPQLKKLFSNLNYYPEVCEEIKRCIALDGNLKDEASKTLKSIRKRLNILRNRIQNSLAKMVENPDLQRYLQEDVVTIRQDRYVLLVRSETQKMLPGIIHGKSSSGSTVFIEPAETVNLNNEIFILREQEKEEIRKILLSLTQLVSKNRTGIKETLNILTHLDLTYAKMRFSQEYQCIIPQTNTTGYVKVLQARHPLLIYQVKNSLKERDRIYQKENSKIKEKEVVPIDFEIGKDFSAVLITGPNTGGKTVTLKTVGLLCLMTMAGIPIPAAEGSEIAIFNHILADIGDEQSISQNLSTFSSHLNRISNMLKLANGSDDLLLLDELGAGTDPTEGSALAMAILDHLLQQQVRVIATSHYGALKAFAYQKTGMQNASVQFDPETLQPTYKVIFGAPGGSQALVIAHKLGLNPNIIKRSREFMDKHSVFIEDLIHKLQIDEGELKQKYQEIQKMQEEIEEIRKKESDHYKILQEEKDKFLEEANLEARLYLQSKIKEIEDLLHEVQTEKDPDVKKQILKEALKFSKEQPKPVKKPKFIKSLEKKEISKLSEGQWVYLEGVGLKGKILAISPDKTQVQVQIGDMKTSIDVSQIRLLEDSHLPKSDRYTKKESSYKVTIQAQKKHTISPELHLRGLTVEEALPQIDKYIDDALVAGLSQITLIHGVGTGALGKAVHEFLKQHAGVAGHRWGEAHLGGTGITIVTLKS